MKQKKLTKSQKTNPQKNTNHDTNDLNHDLSHDSGISYNALTSLSKSKPLILKTLVGFCMIVFVCLLYGHTLKAPFVFDDIANIVKNPFIRLTSLGISQISNLFENTYSATRPVAMLSFGLNYYFGGYNVLGYHSVNMIIHILAGFFLYLFLKCTFQTKAFSQWNETQKESTAIIASILWLINPVQTQSVTYIVQRMNCMASMFYILSLWLYAKARSTEKLSKKRSLFVGCAIAGTMAIGSKEIAITLPLFIMLYEWFFISDLNVEQIKNSLRLIVGLGVLMLFVIVLYTGNPFTTISEAYKTADFTLTQRLLTETRVVIYYLALMLLPHPSRLNLDYDFSISMNLFQPITTFLSLIIILTAIGFAIRNAKTDRILSFCILWYFGQLVVESSVLALDLVFEHRLYLPSMMMILFFVIICMKYINSRWGMILFFGFVFIFNLSWTYERNSVWCDDVALWRDSTEKSIEKARPYTNLGKALFDKGLINDAIKAYQEALNLKPDFVDALNNMGVALYRSGKNDEAIEYYKKAAQVNPNYVDAYYNMANALFDSKKIETAIALYNQVITMLPEHVEAHFNLGNALASINKLEDAKNQFKKTLELNPKYSDAYNNLGNVLYSLGKIDEAIESFHKTIRLNPRDASARSNLGMALAKKGKQKEAIQEFQRALEINENNAQIHNNLGYTFEKQNQPEKATEHYKEALRLQPDFVEAHKNIARIFEKQGKYKEAEEHYQTTIKINPEDSTSYQVLADLYAKQKKHDEAIRHYETALSKSDNARQQSNLNYFIGNQFQLLGDSNRAATFYQKAVEINPKAVEPLKKLAVININIKRYDIAIQYYKQVVALQPKNALNLYNLACIYSKNSQVKEAIESLTQAIYYGYQNWDLIKSDHDLDFVRDTPAFKELIRKQIPKSPD